MVNIKMNWEKVLTEVFSSIILCIIGGAGFIVWNGATTVEQKIDTATSSLKTQNTNLVRVVQIVEKEINDLQLENKSLKDRVEIIEGNNLFTTPKNINTPSTLNVPKINVPVSSTFIQDQIPSLKNEKE